MIRSISKSPKRSLRSMQAGLSSILFRRLHFPFVGEAKALLGYFRWGSHEKRDLPHPFPPYGEGDTGRVAHNGSLSLAKIAPISFYFSIFANKLQRRDAEYRKINTIGRIMKYYSKTQVLILFSLTILSALLTIGCEKSGKRGAEGKGDQATAMPSSEAEYKGLKTVADSTYNGWHIIIQEANTDVKIENSDLFDKKALITPSRRMGSCYLTKKSLPQTDCTSPSTINLLCLRALLSKSPTPLYISPWGLLSRKQTKGFSFSSPSQKMVTSRSIWLQPRSTNRTLSPIFTSCTPMRTYKTP